MQAEYFIFLSACFIIVRSFITERGRIGMAKLKFGVVVFPGTNCDQDSHWVASEIMEQDARYIWHTESDISDIDVVFIPGGFSYGDYLRAGAIAKLSPVLKSVVKHAEKGKYVLGVCNGFQVLAETGLIRGAFLNNKHPHFLCKHQTLRVSNNRSPFTSTYSKGQVLKIPIAHAEGNYYLNNDDLKYTLDNNLIAFQYCDSEGKLSEAANPNGSTQHIAGVLNKQGNVLGMMPHPERASEKELGSEDGRGVFESLIKQMG